MNKRVYTLYCNNISFNLTHHFNQVLASLDPAIKYEVIELNNINGESSRGIPPIGISLFCHFITKEYIIHIPSATKIYNEGMGYGINLLNVNLDFVNTKNETINEITSKIVGSIKFCNKYIKFNL